ncbi:MAG TPA: amidohydrolase, partial [Pedococcus sp.]
MTAPVLHLTGPLLVGPEEVRDEAWVVGGRLTFERPAATGADVVRVDGWVLPGLVDAHCHVGLDAHGAVDRETTERQALGDRAAGTLLIRDAGSPADTRWVDDREDLPKIIRAGRHIARTRRYIRNYAHEVEPDQLVERVRLEARAGDGWVKLVGDWIDRDLGDLAPCWPLDVLKEAVAAAHEEGARVT